METSSFGETLRICFWVSYLSNLDVGYVGYLRTFRLTGQGRDYGSDLRAVITNDQK